MRDYRLYCLDGSGKFTTVHEIDAKDDAEALQKSRDLKLLVKCELWDKERMVAVIEPYGS
jgi:hypothetical protein